MKQEVERQLKEGVKKLIKGHLMTSINLGDVETVLPSWKIV